MLRIKLTTKSGNNLYYSDRICKYIVANNDTRREMIEEVKQNIMSPLPIDRILGQLHLHAITYAITLKQYNDAISNLL